MMWKAVTPLALLALGACATSSGESPIRVAPPGECNLQAGQRFEGQKATAELGARLLDATGAQRLRWVPPRTAVTMDFQADRLTVSYDDDMVITKVSCG